MTLREKYDSTDDWRLKANTINFYHKLARLRKINHKLKDTAEYFGIAVSTVSEDVQLAENMDHFANCASRKGALTMLKEIQPT